MDNGRDMECCGCGLTLHTEDIKCPDCGCDLEPMLVDADALREELAAKDAEIAALTSKVERYKNGLDDAEAVFMGDIDRLESDNLKLKNELATLRELTRMHTQDEIPPKRPPEYDGDDREWSIDVLVEGINHQKYIGFYDFERCCLLAYLHGGTWKADFIGWYFLPGTKLDEVPNDNSQ